MVVDRRDESERQRSPSSYWSRACPTSPSLTRQTTTARIAGNRRNWLYRVGFSWVCLGLDFRILQRPLILKGLSRHPVGFRGSGWLWFGFAFGHFRGGFTDSKGSAGFASPQWPNKGEGYHLLRQRVPPEAHRIGLRASQGLDACVLRSVTTVEAAAIRLHSLQLDAPARTMYHTVHSAVKWTRLDPCNAGELSMRLLPS